MNRYEPDALNHEPLFFWAHLDDEQRADLAQTLQQIHGVVDGDGIDGVCLGEDAHEFAQPVVLPVEEAEHHPHQLGVLDEGLLGPVDHGVGNKLLQRTCQGERYDVTTMWRILCAVEIDYKKGFNVQVMNTSRGNDTSLSLPCMGAKIIFRYRFGKTNSHEH